MVKGAVGELHATFVGNYSVWSACVRSVRSVSVSGMSGTICCLAPARLRVTSDVLVAVGLRTWHTLEA